MYQLDITGTPSLELLKLAVERVEKNVLEDLKPFWDDVATKIVAKEIARIFATEGYGTWPALSPTYALWKNRVYPGRTILRLKNNYFRAATKKGDGGNIFVSDKDSMTWGVNLGYFRTEFGYPYPVVHESGSAAMNLPARPVFGLAETSGELMTDLENGFMRWIDAGVRRELGEIAK